MKKYKKYKKRTRSCNWYRNHYGIDCFYYFVENKDDPNKRDMLYYEVVRATGKIKNTCKYIDVKPTSMKSLGDMGAQKEFTIDFTANNPAFSEERLESNLINSKDSVNSELVAPPTFLL